ncbi:hypothetical protein QR680_007585 [Steinernema hermaphroditum]|uniref:Uncharacterized protein n=1 Tax=Steinernema hermaphroditum TaxID=289476 RepID=A0AA39IFS4_9BILA|nr:hypothetical protein QR680_007576 [Steinernema hermaphroditum]KAK0422458.1 hypothetical protein QR680_007585 [Steinernema hermaphroditum]
MDFVPFVFIADVLSCLPRCTVISKIVQIGANWSKYAAKRKRTRAVEIIVTSHKYGVYYDFRSGREHPDLYSWDRKTDDLQEVSLVNYHDGFDNLHPYDQPLDENGKRQILRIIKENPYVLNTLRARKIPAPTEYKNHLQEFVDVVPKALFLEAKTDDLWDKNYFNKAVIGLELGTVVTLPTFHEDYVLESLEYGVLRSFELWLLEGRREFAVRLLQTIDRVYSSGRIRVSPFLKNVIDADGLYQNEWKVEETDFNISGYDLIECLCCRKKDKRLDVE